MTFPPLLLGISILFWGWRVDMLPLAGIMALLLEAPSRLPWQWTVSQQELRRMADLGSLLGTGVMVYAYFTQGPPQTPIFTLRMIPIVFFPLIVVAAYGRQVTVPLDVLFFSLRGKSDQFIPTSLRHIHMFQLAFCVTLIAAGADAQPDPWYYPLVAMLVVVGLWPMRAPRMPHFRWLTLVVLAVGVGFGIHNGLSRLQWFLEHKLSDWLGKAMTGQTDPYRTSTAIGEIGKLKQSDRILFRVEQTLPHIVPLNLRQGVYTYFDGKEWSSYNTQFRSIVGSSGINWTLSEVLPDPPPDVNSIILHAFFSTQKEIIPLPAGTILISHTPAEKMQISQYGIVVAQRLPKFATISVKFASDHVADAPPGLLDLTVTPSERETTDRFIQETYLDRLSSPTQQRDSLLNLFQEHFRYTLKLDQEQGKPTSVGDFLLVKRAGHCEYFATATVFILRRLGIPARYITGYSVQEYDPGRNAFVVRQRHAHAWVSVYLDGTWKEMDPTPSVWFYEENQASSIWQPFLDGWFNARIWFQNWQFAEQNREGWLIVGTVSFLVFIVFLFRRGNIVHCRRQRASRKTGSEIEDSVFFAFQRIEQILTAAGLGRPPAEPLTAWLTRIGRHELLPLLDKYYRLRFDPLGLPADDERALRRAVDDWFAGTSFTLPQTVQPASPTTTVSSPATSPK